MKRWLAALLLTGSIGQAYACSCPIDNTPTSERLDRSAQVMVVEVVGFETRKLRVDGKAVRARWVVLRPRQVIKGNPDLSRRYYGYLGELWSSCSARAKRRDLLLTYALSDAPIYLGGCSWSGDLSYEGTRTELDTLLRLTEKSGEPIDGSP